MLIRFSAIHKRTTPATPAPSRGGKTTPNSEMSPRISAIRGVRTCTVASTLTSEASLVATSPAMLSELGSPLPSAGRGVAGCHHVTD